MTCEKSVELRAVPDPLTCDLRGAAHLCHPRPERNQR